MVEPGHFEYTRSTLSVYDVVLHCFHLLPQFVDSLYRKVEVECVVILVLL